MIQKKILAQLQEMQILIMYQHYPKEEESIWENFFVWKITEISDTECEALSYCP